MEFFCRIFNNFLLLEFICLWSCTVFWVLLSSSNTLKKNIKEIEVLMSLELFCFWTSFVFGVLLSASHVQNAWKKLDFWLHLSPCFMNFFLTIPAKELQFPSLNFPKYSEKTTRNFYEIWCIWKISKK